MSVKFFNHVARKLSSSLIGGKVKIPSFIHKKFHYVKILKWNIEYSVLWFFSWSRLKSEANLCKVAFPVWIKIIINFKMKDQRANFTEVFQNRNLGGPVYVCVISYCDKGLMFKSLDSSLWLILTPNIQLPDSDWR